MKLIKDLPVALACLAMAITPASAQDLALPDLSIVGPTMDFVDQDEFTDVIAYGPGAMPAPMPFALPLGPEGPPDFFIAAPGARPGCPIMPEMNLSDEQLEKLNALKNAFLDKAGPKMFELSTAKRHLRNTMTAATVDAKAARALQDKINSLSSEVANMKLDSKLAGLEVFTPEQRKEMRERMMKASCCPMGMGRGRMMMRHMMKMRRGPGGPHGPGPDAPLE